MTEDRSQKEIKNYCYSDLISMQQGWVPSSSSKAGVPLGEQAAYVLYFLAEGNREKPFWSLPVAISAVTPTVRIKNSSDVSFPVAILQVSHIFTSLMCCLIYC